MIKKYRILIIEDHQLIIEGYKTALNNIFPNIKNTKFIIQSSRSINNAEIKLEKLTLPYDLIILDLNFPNIENMKFMSSEDLGNKIRKKLPNTPIMIITANGSRYRINSIMESLNPEGYLIKSEITPSDFVNAVHSLLKGKCHYGKSVSKILKKRILKYYEIDSTDILIMQEICNGTKSKNLTKYIPLSKSGIEKRKRKLMELFNSENDRELIMYAKKEGFI